MIKIDIAFVDFGYIHQMTFIGLSTECMLILYKAFRLYWCVERAPKTFSVKMSLRLIENHSRRICTIPYAKDILLDTTKFDDHRKHKKTVDASLFSLLCGRRGGCRG
jgi:hypothetical protein